MKKGLKRMLSIAIAIGMVLLSVSSAVSDEVKMVSITNPKTRISLGDTHTFKAEVSPTTVTNKKITWTSSDTKIAIIDKNGKLLPNAVGTTTITAKSANGKTATCKVTVYALEETEVTIKTGQIENIFKGADKLKYFVTSNENIATIDKNGNVKGLCTGSVDVTARDNKNNLLKCKVIVVPANEISPELAGDQIEKFEKKFRLGGFYEVVLPNKNIIYIERFEGGALTLHYSPDNKIYIDSRLGTYNYWAERLDSEWFISGYEIIPKEEGDLLFKIIGSNCKVINNVYTAQINGKTYYGECNAIHNIGPEFACYPKQSFDNFLCGVLNNSNIKITEKENNKIRIVNTRESFMKKFNEGGVYEVTLPNDNIMEFHMYKYGCLEIRYYNGKEMVNRDLDKKISGDEFKSLLKFIGAQYNEVCGAMRIEYKLNGKVYYDIVGFGESVLLDDLEDFLIYIFNNCPTNTVESERIRLSPEARISLGETLTLEAEVSSNAVNKKVTWSSSDTSIATIDANGKITPNGVGSTIITAKISSGEKATCKVTVYAYALVDDEVTIYEDNIIKIFEGADKLKSFATSDKNIATINNQGRVRGIKAGTAYVTARDNNNKLLKCKIKVGSTVEFGGIKITNPKTKISLGETYRFSAEVNLGNRRITWTSSDTTVAIIDEYGLLLPNATGTTIITAKNANGKTATCKVTVYAVEKEEVTIKVGETKNIFKGADKLKYFATADKSVLTIDNKGNVKGLKEGTVYVTARDRNNKLIKCQITIEK